jgi:hypothetical protein
MARTLTSKLFNRASLILPTALLLIASCASGGSEQGADGGTGTGSGGGAGVDGGTASGSSGAGGIGVDGGTGSSSGGTTGSSGGATGSSSGGTGSSGSGTTSSSGGTASKDGGPGGGDSGGLGGNDGAAGEGGMAAACTNPTCVVSNNGCSEGSGPAGSTYYLYDNKWNCGPSSGQNCGPEKLYGCSYSSWYVTSNQPAGNTAVLTYPAIQANFANNPLVSSFHTITSTFAEKSPHVGDYEVAYDIWLNGQKNELMIWVDNYNQTPAGSKVATNVSLGGRTYDVWSNPSSGYMIFYANTTFTSGTVDILEIFNYAIQHNLLPANSTLSQLTMGVEICSTNGQDATWYFNNFSVTAN